MGAALQKDADFDKLPIQEQLMLIQLAVILLTNYKNMKKLETIDKRASDLFMLFLISTYYNKFKEAIEVGSIILKIHKFIPVYLIQSNSFLRLGLIDQAQQYLQEALQVKPNCARYYYNKVKLCLHKKEYQEAIKYLNQINDIKPNSYIDYNIGLVYQEINEHVEAINYFGKAHDVLQKKKYFLAKMKSFMALEKYEEALECCSIAISLKPGKKELYEVKAKILKQLNREEESEQVKIQGLHQDENYSIEIFEEKRRLDETRNKLIQRQSKIKVNQGQSKINLTQSKILLNKQNQQITCYLDSIYFTFSYFFALYNDTSNDCSNQIANYLSKKQNIIIPNFTDMIRTTIQSCYPDINKLNVHQISDILIQWYNKKIKDQHNNIFKKLYEIFHDLTNIYVKQLLIERLNESFDKSLERKKKNNEFYMHLSSICEQVEQRGYHIYKESGGLLGLEHAILILGFMIKFTQLIDDSEDFGTLIFRGIKQEDFTQYLSSQSKIKKKSSQNMDSIQAFQGLGNSSKLILQKSLSEGSMDQHLLSKFL